MYCRKCGFEIPDDSAFCVKCGTPVEGIAKQPLKTEPVTIKYEEKKSADAKPAKKKKTGLIIVCVAVVLALALAGLYFFVLKGSNNDATELPTLMEKKVSILDDKEKLAEITASVLKLECYDITGEVYATGSGFIAFESDLIVTNYHVIEDHPFAIKALSEDGRTFEIEIIVVYNEEMDVAILKTKGSTGLAPLSFAEKDVEKTDKVVAIGSPLGLMNTVSDGIVSGFTQIGDESVIQFTASISHGSSGGVLLNEEGEVVGVTFASFSDGQNLNIAIPIQYVDALYNQASPAKEVTVKQFFDAVEHVYPISFIFDNLNEYRGKTVTVEGNILDVYIDAASSDSECYVLAVLGDLENNAKTYSLTDALYACQKGNLALIMIPYDEANDICQTMQRGDYYTASGKADYVSRDGGGFSLYAALRRAGLSEAEAGNVYEKYKKLPALICN